jgi:hypothetical protein
MSETLKHTLKTITGEFQNYNEYKENYNWMLQLPLVKQLMKKNSKLEKMNKKLIYLLYSKNTDINTEDSDSDSEDNNTNIPIIYPEEKVSHCKYTQTLSKETPFVYDKNKLIFEGSLNNYPEEDVVILSEKLAEVKVKIEKIVEVVETETEEVEEIEEETEDVEEEETEEVEEETEEVDTEEVDEVEEEVEEETEEVEEETEEDTEEVEEVEEVEEEEVEEEETEEVEEVEEEETEEVEEEEETEEVEEEEEEEVIEVKINGKIYYTSNITSGIIYDVDDNGDVSLEVGCYKNGKPSFY